LRNTCYLNSILQYFYSVNAVRDVVLNAEQSQLTSTEQGVQEVLKSAGSSDLEPGRAFVGSECESTLVSPQPFRVCLLTRRQSPANCTLCFSRCRPLKIAP
jgi:hypothetical protein